MLNAEDFLRIVDATPLVSIDLVIRNEHDQVLLGLRTNRPAQNMWFVPGGRIRKNEKIRDALRRVSEFELGHAITEATLLGAYDHMYPDNFHGRPGISTHYVVLAHEYRLPSGTALKADPQHERLEWWNIPDLLASPDVHENTKIYFRL
jgi:colanic acid biosynthesis protein WcaH